MDGFRVVGLVGARTVLPEDPEPPPPLVVLALGVVVWLFGGACVAAVLGFVQTKTENRI